MYDDALTQDERDDAHTLRCSCWCALCGKQSWWSCRHWCRYRASSPRKHNIPVIEFSLLVHFCTCSQTVCCDRQFFPVAIYCTLLHRENGSFGVLCLHFVPSTAPGNSHRPRRTMHWIRVVVQFLRQSAEPCAAPPTSPFMALLMDPRAVKAHARLSVPAPSLLFCEANQIADLPRFPQMTPLFQLRVPVDTFRDFGKEQATTVTTKQIRAKTGDRSWLLQGFLPTSWRIERRRILAVPSRRPGEAQRPPACPVP